jgi:hypothetical protein
LCREAVASSDQQLAGGLALGIYILLGSVALVVLAMACACSWSLRTARQTDSDVDERKPVLAPREKSRRERWSDASS